MALAQEAAAGGGLVRLSLARSRFGVFPAAEAGGRCRSGWHGAAGPDDLLPLAQLLAIVERQRAARCCGALILLEAAPGWEKGPPPAAALRACIRPQDPLAAAPSGCLLAWLEGLGRSALPRRLERLRQALLARGVPLRRLSAVAVDAAERRPTEELFAVGATALIPLP